jgi:hypothetical protein
MKQKRKESDWQSFGFGSSNIMKTMQRFTESVITIVE